MSGVTVGSLDDIATGHARDDARRMLARGASERQAAEALGVSPSTIHRWRQADRAAVAAPPAPAAPPAGEQDAPDTSVTPAPQEPAETLEALRDRRDNLAAQHGALLGQAQAAREAVEDCDARRLDALAGGGDSARFAAERVRLEAEHARLTQDASVVGAWFAETEAEITRREGERAEVMRLAQERAAREAAIAEGEQLAHVARDELRSAVLGHTAVGELARVASRLAQLEQIAGRGWDVLPPALPAGARDPWHWDVMQLWQAARAGDLSACQAVLGRLGGAWADRDPAAAGGPVVGGTALSGPRPDPGGLADHRGQRPWLPGTVSLDEHGRPLPPDEPGRSPYPPHRHPSGLPAWR